MSIRVGPTRRVIERRPSVQSLVAYLRRRICTTMSISIMNTTITMLQN